MSICQSKTLIKVIKKYCYYHIHTVYLAGNNDWEYVDVPEKCVLIPVTFDPFTHVREQTHFPMQLVIEVCNVWTAFVYKSGCDWCYTAELPRGTVKASASCYLFCMCWVGPEFHLRIPARVGTECGRSWVSGGGRAAFPDNFQKITTANETFGRMTGDIRRRELGLPERSVSLSNARNLSRISLLIWSLRHWMFDHRTPRRGGCSARTRQPTLFFVPSVINSRTAGSETTSFFFFFFSVNEFRSVNATHWLLCFP